MAPVVGLDQISYKSKRTYTKRVFVPDFDADYNKTNFEQLTNKNSYKSILCIEHTYLLELVRYIHLNTPRAYLFKDLSALDTYPNTGHRMLMGKESQPWLDTEHVLKRFGRTAKAARRKYREFVSKGIPVGKRPYLVGGGLVRSMGEWAAVKVLRKAKVYMKWKTTNAQSEKRVL